MAPSPFPEHSALLSLLDRVENFRRRSRSRSRIRFDRLFRSPASLIMLTGILATLPVIVAGLSLSSHDGFFHAHWHAGFAGQLAEGNPYPRWMGNTNGGLGSPVFFFYPPLPYYIASLFAFLSPLDPSGIHRLGLLAMSMMILSGFAARAWLRRFMSDRRALLGSLVYMIAPFHLALDLWARGAMGQFCAYAWLPLILIAVHGIAERRRSAPFFLSLAYAALILTNIPTLLIFSPVPPLYAVAVAGRSGRIRSGLLTLAAMGLGGGLAGAYLYPAWAHRKYINLPALTEGLFDFHNNFLLTPATLFSLSFKSQIAWTVLLFALALFAAWHAERRNRDRNIPLAATEKFWRRTIIASLFMMSPAGTVVWESIPPLRLVQFPMRFTLLFTLALAACLPSLAGKTHLLPGRAARLLPALAAVLSLVLSAKFGLAHYGQALRHHTSPVTQQQLRRAVDAVEYRTLWSSNIIRGGTDTLKALIERLEKESAAGSIVGGEGKISAIERKGNTFVLRTDGTTDLTVRLHSFYYPGRIARADSGAAIVSPSPGDGLLLVTIPPGKRTVTVETGVTEEEKKGYGISLVSLVILAAAAIVSALRKRNR